MKLTIKCINCKKIVDANPRIKNQNYCNAMKCQQVRKNLWKQQKLDSDPDYKKSQKEYRKEWNTKNPKYWKNYREKHPKYCDRNRLLQKIRDAKNRSKKSCKRDALIQILYLKPGTYEITPIKKISDKRDSLKSKVIVIPK